MSKSVAPIWRCRDTRLAVIAPPGIILLLLVYFFSAFFPFAVPEEGVVLELRGASELGEGPAGALPAGALGLAVGQEVGTSTFEERTERAPGVAIGQGSGSVNFSVTVRVTVDPGTKGSMAGGGGGTSEGDSGLDAIGVSSA